MRRFFYQSTCGNIAGRKSIPQMTLAQTVLMIAIGSMLIQPVVQENVRVTFGVGVMLVLTLIVVEFGQLKWDFLEKERLKKKLIPILLTKNYSKF